MPATGFHLSGAITLYDDCSVGIILILFSPESNGSEFAVGVLALLN